MGPTIAPMRSLGRVACGQAGRRGARAFLATLAAFPVLLATGCERAPEPAAASAPTRPRALAPDLVPVYRLIAQGRFEPARSMAQQVLAARPHDAQAMLLIGLTYAKADNHGAAEPWFERSLASDPDYYIGHEYRGDSLFRLGRLVEARRHFEAFLGVVPDEPKAHYQLGLVDAEEGKLTDAEARFRRAIELMQELREREPRVYATRTPELAGYHARIADLHVARGAYEAARDELILATELCPENISAFYTLSVVQRRLGDDERADAALARYEAARDAILARQGAPRR
jgi:tetratricopeptide (TPR) repeat protein